MTGGRLGFKGQVLRTDGSESFEIEAEGAATDAARIGKEAGRSLAARLPEGVLFRDK
jgi:hydroxymethylbilane synthase